MTRPRLSIIVPACNKWDLTRDCLRSLADHTHEASFELVLADNGSEDETAALAGDFGRDLFGAAFHHLRLDSNRNFGPACNLGAARASGDLLFFLNNDTLATPGWLPPLLRAMEKPGVAGVGPLLAYADDTIQHAGIAIEPAGNKLGHLYAHLPVTHPLARKSRSFPAITAAALLVPKKAFLDAGGFFEGYVNGFEDVDLGFRLSAGGALFQVEPDSLIRHLESQTPRRHEADLHNSELLLSRWNLDDRSNLAQLARDDAYELKVDPTLLFLLTPAKERVPGLIRRLREPGAKVVQLWDLLQEEPYWEEGYTFLAAFLEQAGETRHALNVLSQGLLLNPSLALHEQTLRVSRAWRGPAGSPAGASRNPQEFEALEAALQARQAAILDRGRYEAELQLRLNSLRLRGETELAALCEEAGREAEALRRAWLNGERQ